MRGVAPSHKLLHHGVNCSLSTNNVLNPFTPFGDCSLVRMANLYANICQVGAKGDIRECFHMISSRSAKLMNLKDYGLTPAAPRTSWCSTPRPPRKRSPSSRRCSMCSSAGARRCRANARNCTARIERECRGNETQIQNRQGDRPAAQGACRQAPDGSGRRASEGAAPGAQAHRLGGCASGGSLRRDAVEDRERPDRALARDAAVARGRAERADHGAVHAVRPEARRDLREGRAGAGDRPAWDARRPPLRAARALGTCAGEDRAVPHYAGQEVRCLPDLPACRLRVHLHAVGRGDLSPCRPQLPAAAGRTRCSSIPRRRTGRRSCAACRRAICRSSCR